MVVRTAAKTPFMPSLVPLSAAEKRAELLPGQKRHVLEVLALGAPAVPRALGAALQEAVDGRVVPARLAALDRRVIPVLACEPQVWQLGDLVPEQLLDFVLLVRRRRGRLGRARLEEQVGEGLQRQPRLAA